MLDLNMNSLNTVNFDFNPLKELEHFKLDTFNENIEVDGFSETDKLYNKFLNTESVDIDINDNVEAPNENVSSSIENLNNTENDNSILDNFEINNFEIEKINENIDENIDENIEEEDAIDNDDNDIEITQVDVDLDVDVDSEDSTNTLPLLFILISIVSLVYYLNKK